ncbi:ATP-dependent helicase, partial [Micromonospora sp. NPDC000018]
MLVVHGVWRSGFGLAVWAEDSTLPARAPRRPGRAPRERPHPFAAGHPTLAAALAEAAEPADLGTALLTLPTRAGSPLDSPELVRTAVAEPVRGPVTLAGWRVPVLRYAPDAALPLLRALDGLAVVPGATLRHLAELADFAVDLAARGRVLPGLAAPASTPSTGGAPTSTGRVGGAGRSGRPGHDGTRRRVSPGGDWSTVDGQRAQVAARAVWRPLLTGTDAAWARALALALPPAARAAVTLSGHPGTAATAPGHPGTADDGPGIDDGPGALVADALDALTDAAVRVTLAETALARGVRPNGAVPAWLAALSGPVRDFAAEPAALDTLRAELDAWQRDAAGGAVRA